MLPLLTSNSSLGIAPLILILSCSLPVGFMCSRLSSQPFTTNVYYLIACTVELLSWFRVLCETAARHHRFGAKFCVEQTVQHNRGLLHRAALCPKNESKQLVRMLNFLLNYRSDLWLSDFLMGCHISSIEHSLYLFHTTISEQLGKYCYIVRKKPYIKLLLQN